MKRKVKKQTNKQTLKLRIWVGGMQFINKQFAFMITFLVKSFCLFGLLFLKGICLKRKKNPSGDLKALRVTHFTGAPFKDGLL